MEGKGAAAALRSYIDREASRFRSDTGVAFVGVSLSSDISEEDEGRRGKDMFEILQSSWVRNRSRNVVKPLTICDVPPADDEGPY